MATASRRSPRRRASPGRKGGLCHVCKKSHPVWWNSDKQGWFLSLRKEDGKGYRKLRLAREHDEAIAAWHKLEAGVPTADFEPVPSSAINTTAMAPGETMLVGQLVNLFLDNIQAKVSAKRFKISKTYLLDLCRFMGADSIGSLRVGGVARVEKWLDAHEGWQGCRRSVISRVKQVFLWGEKQGYFASSPIKSLARPRDNTRVALFNPAQVAAILANADETFALAFRCLLATGCRPDEFCSVTADDVRTDQDGELYWWVEHKNQRYTGSRRRIYLTDEMQKITRQRMKSHPSGKLFRNELGTPWAANYLNKVFRTVCESPACVKLGLDKHTTNKRKTDERIAEKSKMKGKKKANFRKYDFVLYTARHTFAHRLLTGYHRGADGQPIILGYSEIAEFMGNSAREVERTYGKLAKATTVLSKRLKGVALG
jgi:integrase